MEVNHIKNIKISIKKSKLGVNEILHL